VNFSEPFIRRPVMTTVLTVSVILFGVLSYLRLPVNDLPAVDYPVIQVQVNYPGASPDTVANNIAIPLERQFMQINGLELVTSKSSQGNASLTLQFALDKNVMPPPRMCRRPYRGPQGVCRSICLRRQRTPKTTPMTSRSCTSR